MNGIKAHTRMQRPGLSAGAAPMPLASRTS